MLQECLAQWDTKVFQVQLDSLGLPGSQVLANLEPLDFQDTKVYQVLLEVQDKKESKVPSVLLVLQVLPDP